MTRIALGLAYDGRDWHGWQSQPHRRTVQDALEDALSRFADRPVRVACAGRTDRGVHALGQVVHFDCDATRTTAGWVRGVNALLPPSIAVSWAVPAHHAPAAPVLDAHIDARSGPHAEDPQSGPHGTPRAAPHVDAPLDERVSAHIDATFDARFDALARTYRYLLLVAPQRSPHWVGRAGWIHTPLDLAAMRVACASLLGTHDYSAFRSAECQAKSPVKTMTVASVEVHGAFVCFTFRANAFLHHMVRNLVGTLVAIGRGRQAPDWMTTLLAGRDRSVAAPTFMPDGLYLARVEYPSRVALPGPLPFAHVHAGFDDRSDAR